MKTTVHKANTRGHANYGWLDTSHTFSFSSYYDPARMGFGVLRVLNDDYVAGGKGFGTHGHDNMEIVSIPLSGALEHSDSTGNRKVIRSGEVQIMSAGKGIRHAEYNHSPADQVNFLQIWILPKERNIEPRYDQKLFEAVKNTFQTVVSPGQENGALWINQDAFFSLGHFENGQSAAYKIQKQGNGVYVFVIEGSVETAGQVLGKRDGAGISEVEEISLKFTAPSKVLLIEVPMQYN